MMRILQATISWLRKLRHRPSLLTILSNNGNTLSLMLTNFVSVPFALHYLTNKEFGLWAFTSQSVGYVFLFDLGVSAAVARLVAGPLAAGNRAEANQWFSLSLTIMVIQALIMGLAGWLLVAPLLRWFEIPTDLLRQAQILWLWFVGVTVVSYLARVLNGLLYAQNRYYWQGFGSILGAWVGLAGFVFLLERGTGVLAYAYSSALQTVCVGSITWLGVVLGPNRFRLDFKHFGLARVRRLYSFSGALSLMQIATMILYSGQTLVVTKIFGLEGAAGFNVSSKLFLAARNLTEQFYYSFYPGWQQLYLKNQLGALIRQWRLRFDLALSAILAGMTVFIAGNRWFVAVWARPELYQGFGFDLGAGLFCVAIIFVSGLAFPQTFAMRVWLRSSLQVTAAALSILLGIVLARFFGTAGVYWGAAVVIPGMMAWYNIHKFRVLLLRPEAATFAPRQWKCLRSLAALAVSAALIGLTRQYSNPVQIAVAALVVMGNLGLFFIDWQHSLINLVTGRNLANEAPAALESRL